MQETPPLVLANLVHLSYNFWNAKEDPSPWYGRAQESLQFDEKSWLAITSRMAELGYGMLILDLGDGIRYKSHPEIAVKGAWDVSRLQEENDRLRSMGIELIPKLNFSTAHDAWLGEYSHCVSSPAYYEVCADLIAEVVSILGKPSYFHVGMDEEPAEYQVSYTRPVSRQGSLFWHDYMQFFSQIESYGICPWVWSDYIWKHRDEFVRNMPKSVLQSNWYYNVEFGSSQSNGKKYNHDRQVQAYRELDAHGYEQMPTVSNWWHRMNTDLTVKFSVENLSRHQLKGFLAASWYPTTAEYDQQNMDCIDYLASARDRHAGTQISR